MAGVDVDGILDGEAVGGAGVEGREGGPGAEGGRGVGGGGMGVWFFGDEDGMVGVVGAEPGEAFGVGGGMFLEGGGGVEDVVIVDGVDGGEVGEGGGADEHESSQKSEARSQK